MGIDRRDIEVTLISAQELKKVTQFGQPACYAVAYVDDRDKKATRVDKRGGLSPAWDTKVVLTCDESLLQRGGNFLTVDIYNFGTLSNKLVGTVKVPLRDIIREGKSSQPMFMAYEVRRPSGKSKGTLNLSVKLGEKKFVNTPNPIHGAGKQQQQKYPSYVVDYANSRQDVPTQYESQAYPAARAGARVDSVTMYPPVTAGAARAGSVYPPPTSSSHTSAAAETRPVYPPPTSAAAHNGTTSSSSDAKAEEPVLAYPATGYDAAFPPQQYGANYAPQYAGQQQYYPSAQANVPYSYQQAYYSKPKPPRRAGGGGMGLGLLGGALGGLLLGDMIGDCGGF